MNRAKKGIGILCGAAIVLVDVGIDITAARTPEALQKAENLGCLSKTVAASLAELRR